MSFRRPARLSALVVATLVVTAGVASAQPKGEAALDPKVADAAKKSVDNGLRFLRVIIDGVLCYRPERIFLLGFSACAAVGGVLAAYPVERVQQIHLAGHAADSDDEGKPLLIDAHDRQVSEDVWALYAKVLEQTGPLPTLIEWDNDVPQWSVLKAESERADRVLKSCAAPAAHLQARRHDLAAVS